MRNLNWSRILTFGGGLQIAITTFAAWKWPEQMPPALVIPLIVFGLLMMAYAIWGMKPHAVYYGELLPKRWLPNWSLQFRIDNRWPASRLVPLSQAAQQAYEKTQGTLAAKTAENEPDGNVREWYVYALADNGKTPLYGVRLPAKKLRRIDPGDLGKSNFVHGGQTMKMKGSDKILWDRVYIKQSDLGRMIRKLKG